MFLQTFKYWRINLAVVPLLCTVTRKLVDESLDQCDIYPRISEEEQSVATEGFCKFIEVLNKIKRPVIARKQKVRFTIHPLRWSFCFLPFKYYYYFLFSKYHGSSRRVSLFHTNSNASSVSSSVPGTNLWLFNCVAQLIFRTLYVFSKST